MTTATQTANEMTYVVAEDAPIGIQLWPTVSPEYAPNFTLASVTRTKDSVIWTYENGKTRHFEIGDKVTVKYDRELIERGTRVEIQDNDRDPSRYESAVIIDAHYRDDDFGYFVRYDNECVVWVREYYVRRLPNV